MNRLRLKTLVLTAALAAASATRGAESGPVPGDLSAADWAAIRAACQTGRGMPSAGAVRAASGSDLGPASRLLRPAALQIAYLKASNAEDGVHIEDEPGDDFGNAVAVSGDTVVVGAYEEDSSATGVDGDQADNSAFDAGAAYVFVRDGNGIGSQQAYLKASNTDIFDGFGHSVAISGDTIVVGAPREHSSATGVNGDQADNSVEAAGAAYVFVRDGNGVWSQQAYLKASNTDRHDYFGSAVATSGDTIVVGAYGEASIATGVNGDQTDNSANSAGAAYVFVRDGGGTWSQQAYLKASNTGPSNQYNYNDFFGSSVAISGDTIVIGARGEESSATGVNGDQADNSAEGAGAAYVFVRDGNGGWNQQAYLKASNTNVSDGFGISVAISGDTLVVGAAGEDSRATGVNGDQADNNTEAAGAAYVFVRNGTAWTQQAYLKASNTDQAGSSYGDQFGFCVAILSDTVVVGAFFEESGAAGVNGDQSDNSKPLSGAAYVFTRSAATWSQRAYLKASNPDSADLFGFSVALSGDTLLIGASLESSGATGVNGDQADNSEPGAGAAYIFDLVRSAIPDPSALSPDSP